jgi:hypothetical protein
MTPGSKLKGIAYLDLIVVARKYVSKEYKKENVGIPV